MPRQSRAKSSRKKRSPARKSPRSRNRNSSLKRRRNRKFRGTNTETQHIAWSGKNNFPNFPLDSIDEILATVIPEFNMLDKDTVLVINSDKYSAESPFCVAAARLAELLHVSIVLKTEDENVKKSWTEVVKPDKLKFDSNFKYNKSGYVNIGSAHSSVAKGKPFTKHNKRRQFMVAVNDNTHLWQSECDGTGLHFYVVHMDTDSALEHFKSIGKIHTCRKILDPDDLSTITEKQFIVQIDEEGNMIEPYPNPIHELPTETQGGIHVQALLPTPKHLELLNAIFVETTGMKNLRKQMDSSELQTIMFNDEIVAHFGKMRS